MCFPSFRVISMIMSFMLVMIGRVREVRHMYILGVSTLEDFCKVSIILIL
jgi:hypothetical protein